MQVLLDIRTIVMLRTALKNAVAEFYLFSK